MRRRAPSVAALGAAAFVFWSCASRPAYVIPDARPAAPAVARSGSDASTLPEVFPGAVWLPYRSLNPQRLEVTVFVNQRPVPALLDTGATHTSIDLGLAGELGVRPTGKKAGDLEDATGQRTAHITGMIDTLRFGSVTLQNLEVLATNHTRLSGLLVGLDVLQRFDLFLAPDAFLVGLFPAGKAPRIPGETVVPLSLEPARGRLRVTGQAPGKTGPVTLPFIVDTGANGSVIDTRTGLLARFEADVSYTTDLEGMLGSVESRGQFVLRPLTLGPHNAGQVRVWTRSLPGRKDGLLGMDVLAATRTVLSPTQKEMRLHPRARRAAHRDLGPEGTACDDGHGTALPCVEVTLQREADRPPVLCVQAAGYRQRRIELAVRLLDAHDVPLLGPAGALQMHLLGRASRTCFPPQDKTGELFAAARGVELAGFRVGDDATWPCPGHEACWTVHAMR